MSRFPCLKVEGGLLAADLVDRIAEGSVRGQAPADFGLPKRTRLLDEIAGVYNDARGYWQAFVHRLERLPESDPATTTTRDLWLIPLLKLLGYDLSYMPRAAEVEGRTYAVSHRAGAGEDAPPVHIVGCRQPLDRRPASGRPRLAPHALLQEYLNRTEHLWGIVTNGYVLRLLRDSQRIARPVYIEFDLQRMMAEENFADFALLYRLVHRTRLPEVAETAADCLLEHYYAQTVAEGGRVRDRLRDGVEKAIRILADGLLGHPQNEDLREEVRTRRLSPYDFYQQLLRLIYRLLFLMVAEERNLLTASRIYGDYYSVKRLRRLCTGRRAYSGHSDLWLGLKTSFRVFADERLAGELDLPPLDGALFALGETRTLNAAHLANRDLLHAVWHLSQYQEKAQAPWRRVNYAALDVEELGSVYESLLEYHPVFSESSGRISFALDPGTERKSTGSYYTPRELVGELVESTLVPVLRERLAQSANPQDKEQALLSITVLDPACGSGHFLLAAARRLGRELARIRTGEEEPSPEEVRLAVREVIGHCIYGVDKNPLAVELCKVALWIESCAPGKPLTFLDHRIKCGDSLVGVLDLKVLREGIPDAAFAPVAGDEPAVARALRKRNRQESSDPVLFFHPAAKFEARAGLDSLRAEYGELAALPDDTPEQVRQKARLYERLRGHGTAWWRENTLCHLWSAPFFAYLTAAAEQMNKIPTNGVLYACIEGRKPDPRFTGIAWALAEKHRFFHWPLEFPEVFAQGGFDVLLCNPPWERIKLQEEEFFAARNAHIANALNKAARHKLIKELPATNPALYQEYQEAKHAAEALSKFLRGSGRFPLTARGDINTYSVFAELFSRLIRPDGRAGVVLPTGIATDDTNKRFFAHLVEKGQLASLYDFENREGIFPGVHKSYKFCLLTLRGTGAKKEPQRCGFFLTRTEHLRDGQRVFTLNAAEFALLNPNTGTCPVFRTRQDAELTKKIYSRVPVLINERTGENPWGVRFMRMFDMANDSRLFRTTERLEDEGYSLVRGRDLGRPDGPCFVRGEEVWLPLYEAKMIWQFDHRFGTYKGVPPETTSTHLPTPREEQYADPDYFVLPRYWVREEEVLARIAKVPPQAASALASGDEGSARHALAEWLRGHETKEVNQIYPLTKEEIRLIKEAESARRLLLQLANARSPRYLLGFRDVTNATNERTAIFTMLPRAGVGHKIPLVFLDNVNVLKTACFIVNLDSLVLDFITRQKIGGTSLSYFILKQLPVLPPDAYTETDLFFILPRVLELVYTAWDLEPFARDIWQDCPPELRKEIVRRWQESCGRSPKFHPDAEMIPPFRWDSGRRAFIRAELDACYAKLYGLTRDELRYILDPQEVYGEDFPGETFRVLKEKETRQFGEYRTRRLVLEAWDRLF